MSLPLCVRSPWPPSGPFWPVWLCIVDCLSDTQPEAHHRTPDSPVGHIQQHSMAQLSELLLPQPWPDRTEVDWTALDSPMRSTLEPEKLNWRKTVLFFLFCFVFDESKFYSWKNLCILNLSEEKETKKEEEKNLTLSRLNFSFWISVCFCLIFLCINYYQWVIV